MMKSPIRINRAVIAMVVILAAMTLIIVPAAGESRGIKAEDYFAFKSLNDVRFSPDGSTIAFVVALDKKSGDTTRYGRCRQMDRESRRC